MAEIAGFVGVRNGSTRKWWIPLHKRSVWQGRGGRFLRQAEPEVVELVARTGSRNKIRSLSQLQVLSEAREPDRVPGVTWTKSVSKWRAQIKRNGKQEHLGYFEHHEDAVDARRRAEVDGV